MINIFHISVLVVVIYRECKCCAWFPCGPTCFTHTPSASCIKRASLRLVQRPLTSCAVTRMKPLWPMVLKTSGSLNTASARLRLIPVTQKQNTSGTAVRRLLFSPSPTFAMILPALKSYHNNQPHMRGHSA